MNPKELAKAISAYKHRVPLNATLYGGIWVVKQSKKQWSEPEQLYDDHRTASTDEFTYWTTTPIEAEKPPRRPGSMIRGVYAGRYLAFAALADDGYWHGITDSGISFGSETTPLQDWYEVRLVPLQDTRATQLWNWVQAQKEELNTEVSEFTGGQLHAYRLMDNQIQDLFLTSPVRTHRLKETFQKEGTDD